MDESVINGANLFFPAQFGIPISSGPNSGSSKNQWLVGLVNSAPYVSPFVRIGYVLLSLTNILQVMLRSHWLLAHRPGMYRIHHACAYVGIDCFVGS